MRSVHLKIICDLFFNFFLALTGETNISAVPSSRMFLRTDLTFEQSFAEEEKLGRLHRQLELH